jgi:predicted CopG family antitoxin
MSLSIALGNCGFLNWGWFIVGRRVISVSEDVYRRLSRLAVERNKTINDLIEELLDSYEGRVGVSSIVEELGEVKAMLRECLDKLGVRELRRVVEADNVKTTPTESKNEVSSDSAFGDNPWIQILRVKYGPQDS